MQVLAEKDAGTTYNKAVKPTTAGVDRFGAGNQAGNVAVDPASGYHSVLVEERVWTSNWINQ